MSEAIKSYGNVLAYLTDFGAQWSGPGKNGHAPNEMT